MADARRDGTQRDMEPEKAPNLTHKEVTKESALEKTCHTLALQIDTSLWRELHLKVTERHRPSI